MDVKDGTDIEHVTPHAASNAKAITIKIERVHAWLERYATIPLRYLWAPAGFGKTVAASQYAQTRKTAVRIIDLDSNATGKDLVEALARSFDIKLDLTYVEFIGYLHMLPEPSIPTEVIIDNIEFADESARQILDGLYVAAPNWVHFVYLARTQAVINASASALYGLAAIGGPDLLVFTQATAIQLVAALESRAQFRINDEAIAKIVDASDGRASAVAALLVDSQNTKSQIPLVLKRLAKGATPPPSPPTPAVSTDLPPSIADPNHATLPVNINVFGRLEMRIGERLVDLPQQRARRLLAFLVTQPSHRIARGRLGNALWPMRQVSLAEQATEASIKAIYTAIARVVGEPNAATYFTANDKIVGFSRPVGLSHAALSDSFKIGTRAEREKAWETALYNYLRVLQLYRAPMYANEPFGGEPWVTEIALSCATMYRTAAQRVSDLDALGVSGSPGALQNTARQRRPPPPVKRLRVCDDTKNVSTNMQHSDSPSAACLRLHDVAPGDSPGETSNSP